MADARERYDIAIIGSGISGSSLGAILARHGLRVVIFEAGVHPKFAVGELAGRNHLPRNKLGLSLLRQSSAGFIGEGAFRQHFFGDATMAEVTRFFASESVKYSASALTLRKRLGFRKRPAAPSRVQVSRG